QQQRERIYAAYEEGVYDSAAFVARRAEKDREIRAAEEALHALQTATEPTDDEVMLANLPLILNVLEVYDTTADPLERNKLLKSIFSRIEYKKIRRCFRNENPASALSLRLYPRRHIK
ncbi:MAG: hypothetical protein ACLRM6_07715, partial [Christensenellales bacterium]